MKQSTQHERVVSFPEKQSAWAVYNSGDPLWTYDMPLSFVREILQEVRQIDTDKLSDDVVEHLMYEEGDDDIYLHLYELKIHPDNYRLTLSGARNEK